jgi:hypothetical protein
MGDDDDDAVLCSSWLQGPNLDGVKSDEDSDENNKKCVSRIRWSCVLDRDQLASANMM